MTSDSDDDRLNRDLHDVIAMLEDEIERLKATLDVYQLNTSETARRAAERYSLDIARREERLTDLRELLDATPYRDD